MIMKAMLLGLVGLVGCQGAPAVLEYTEPANECPGWEDAPVETRRTSTTVLPGSVGVVVAQCPTDHHVVAGHCAVYSVGAKHGVEPMGAYGTDTVQLRRRTSVHAPQADGWQCSGLADELVRLTAHVECRAAGGMDP